MAAEGRCLSVEATSAVWTMRGLTAPEKLVLLRLADKARDDGTEARPSVGTICADTGLSERTVQGALKRLVVKRAVTVAGRHSSGTTIYTVALNPAAGAPPQDVPPAADAGAQDVPLNPAGAAPLPPQELRPIRPTPIHPSKSRSSKRLGTDDDPGFVAFWAAYPRRTSKGAARKAWAAAVKKGNEPCELIAAAERYAVSRADADPQFTPHPSTWLNAEGWADEPLTNGHRSAAHGPSGRRMLV